MKVVKLNLRCNPNSVIYKMYEFNMVIFDHGYPEYLLVFLKNNLKPIERTTTDTAVGSIEFYE